MAYWFSDGFDYYATTSDVALGYWDSLSSLTGVSLPAGRFTGSQCIHWANGSGASLVKSSGVNDAVHHIVCAFRQTSALASNSLVGFLQLSDGATNQVCIVFRSDGVILLTSATPGGTVLATYTNAVTASSAWFGFEFEVVIHPSAGSFTVRRDGATSNSFQATGLNTRPGTNSYANKLTVGANAQLTPGQGFDDLIWRSDASSVAWIGDVRCLQQMPVGDVSTQFSRAPASVVITPQTSATTIAIGAGTARYTAFTATYDGTVGSVTISLGVGYTGNLKCSMFANASGLATSVLGSATTLVNPIAGANTFTFPTPVAVTRGVTYWIGFDSDTSSGTYSATAGNVGLQSTTAYAAFPVASPAASGGQAMIISVTLTLTASYMLVNEPQQDGTTTYVYDSVVGHADLYDLADLPGPATVFAVTTRGFMAKSDAGSRSGQLQIKSGGTTVQSTALVLSSSFLWNYRTDVTNPNGGAAWTASAVNALQVGPVVQA